MRAAFALSIFASVLLLGMSPGVAGGRRNATIEGGDLDLRPQLLRTFAPRKNARLAAARQAREDGDLTQAAHLLEEGGNGKGLLDKLAVWREKAKLNKTAAKTLKSASKAGLVADAKDAVTAQNVMKDAGYTSFLSNWRARRARTGGIGLRFALKFWRVDGALQTSIKNGISDLDAGSLKTAKEHLDLANSLITRDTLKALKTLQGAQRRYYEKAMGYAKHAAQEHDVGGTLDALKVASEAPGLTKGVFDEKLAQRLVALAQKGGGRRGGGSSTDPASGFLESSTVSTADDEDDAPVTSPKQRRPEPQYPPD